MNIPDLRQKAECGSAIAQTVLGTCYLEGVEVEIDHKEAFRLLSAAAKQGASRAMANLAYMYAEGLGTAKNLPEAIWLYEVAAEAGEFLAQVELARIHARGVSVPANPEVARKWYATAAAQEASVGDCEELQEAKAYARKPSSAVRRPKHRSVISKISWVAARMDCGEVNSFCSGSWQRKKCCTNFMPTSRGNTK